MPYEYREYPKWIETPDGAVIVNSAEEERRVRGEPAEDTGREKANPSPASSPGAERVRRYRARRKAGLVAVPVVIELHPAGIARLMRTGWLDARDRNDRRAIADAFLDIGEAALRAGLRPT